MKFVVDLRKIRVYTYKNKWEVLPYLCEKKKRKNETKLELEVCVLFGG